MTVKSLIVIVAIALIIAAVALAFAGWDVVAIVGLLSAVAAMVTPILTLVGKTDTVRNDLRTIVNNTDTTERRQ